MEKKTEKKSNNRSDEKGTSLMSMERDEKQKEVLAGGSPESASSDIDGSKKTEGNVSVQAEESGENAEADSINRIDADIKAGEQEAQRTMKIKVWITIAAVLALIALAILTWNDEEGYFIKIPTDDGQTWSYTISDENLLKGTETSFENGKFQCNFEGLEEGEAEIVMIRTAESDPETILEKRVYHVQIAENKSVVQRSVDREVYE